MEVRDVGRDLRMEKIAKLLLDQPVVEVQAVFDDGCQVRSARFREASLREGSAHRTDDR